MLTADAIHPASIARIESRIAPLRARLASHPLYRSIHTEHDLRVFMQAHVFAVWDFMSLLKALQLRLTTVTVPWVPSRFPASRRFLNEIVLGEESDVYQGRPLSHFEIYLEAMQSAGASTGAIDDLLTRLNLMPVMTALANVPAGPREFTQATFALIEGGNLAAMAAAFTFGREDLIPDMFRALVTDLNRQNSGAFAPFIWYLERHIEVDGEDHGPLSLKMVADLCGTDDALWQQAAEAAACALEARLVLWDAILAQILSESRAETED